MEVSKKYIEEIRGKYPLSTVKQTLSSLSDINVLVVGDTIIDEYIFTLPKGRAIKDPILSLDFVNREKYAGGILAIANQIAQFSQKVHMVTMLGDKHREESFVRENAAKQVNCTFFTKKNSPTTNKQRYIDHVRGGKLFKVEYINDSPIDAQTEVNIIKYLKEELPKYDLVVVGDFGHGFITPAIVDVLETHAKVLAANVQTNSSNLGYNYVTKYKKVSFLSSNENELRLSFADRFNPLDTLIQKLKKSTAFKNVLLTMGGSGCMYINGENTYTSPGLTTDVTDAVGAGDAVFALTALLHYQQVEGNLLAFLANSVGAMAVGIMGNEKNITKQDMITFVEGLYGVENIQKKN